MIATSDLVQHDQASNTVDAAVFLDSKLVVEQVRGNYKVKNAGLLPLYQQASRICRDFTSVSIRHVRREYNTHADALCNEALDNPRSAQPRSGVARSQPRRRRERRCILVGDDRPLPGFEMWEQDPLHASSGLVTQSAT